MTDEDIKERYDTWRSGAPLVPTAPSRVVVGNKELALLHDIATHPLRTITEHYDCLNWNPKIGNTTKDRLLRANLITVDVVQKGRARLKFLRLTTAGKTIITDDGGTITSNGRGSSGHEYWRSILRGICETKGYAVTPEYDLGDGRRVDLRATRGTTVLLIEIETGKSNIAENITKCEGKGTLIMFFTTKNAFDNALPLPTYLISITPDTISTFQDLLD